MAGFTKEGWLFDPVTPGLFLLIPLSSQRCSACEERTRTALGARGIRALCIAHRVDYLVDNPGQLERGAAVRNAVLCLPIWKFHRPDGKMDPGAAVALLNAYLDRRSRLRLQAAARWTASSAMRWRSCFPRRVLQPDHRERATSARWRCMRSPASTVWIWKPRAPFWETRIGVHTGEVIVGNSAARRCLTIVRWAIR